jgi:hypothetical protein
MPSFWLCDSIFIGIKIGRMKTIDLKMFSPYSIKDGISFEKTSSEYARGNLLAKIKFHAMIGRSSSRQFNR